MNAQIREAVSEVMRQQGMTRADLARKVKKQPQAISRALNGGKDSGSIPETWQVILDALGLEVVIRPKQP